MPTKNISALLVSRSIIAMLVYLDLVIHDYILYPHLGVLGIAELSGLRWLLLALPIVGTLGFMHKKGVMRWLSGAAWFVFIPYSLYSLLEVRHVAEICRLSTGYFTQHCSHVTWQVVPSFLYGLIGLVAFVYSMNVLTIHQSRLVTAVIVTATAFYAAIASVFGIFTRLNVWGVIFAPSEVLRSVSLLHDASLWLNIFILWAIFSLVSNILVLWLRKRI